MTTDSFLTGAKIHPEAKRLLDASERIYQEEVALIRERLRPEFEAFAFTRDEQELLASLPSSSRPEWVFRFWCAKEALAKALGRGLMDGPKSIRVQGLDRETGIVAAVGHGRLVEALPEFAGRTLVVYTVREDDWVVATTLCEEQP